MNFVLLFLGHLLLVETCLTANIDQVLSRSEVQQQNMSERGIQVDALDGDFLYPIFDESSLEEMLQFAKDPRIADFVKKEIFPVKYHNYWFGLMNMNDGNDPEILVFEKCLNIGGYNFFSDIVKHFGESIQKLSICCSDLLSKERSIELCQYISEHCSESLTSLDLFSIEVNTLMQFEKRFSKVEKLILRFTTNEVGSLQPIDDIFPELRQLTVSYYDSDPDNSDHTNRVIESDVPHLGHLEHLETFFHVTSDSDLATIHKQLENLFQKNSQLRSFIYACYAGDFIQVINKYLPSLDSLEINGLDSKIQPVHLDHVKRFSIRGESPGPFERLSFSRLESLSLVYFWLNEPGSSPRDSWIQFFKNHQSLKQLSCRLCTSEDDGLVEFLAELPSLQVIQINSPELLENNLKAIDLFERLIGNHVNLLKFQYQVDAIQSRPNESQLAICREKFGNEWNVTRHLEDDLWPTLTLERKD